MHLSRPTPFTIIDYCNDKNLDPELFVGPSTNQGRYMYDHQHLYTVEVVDS